MKKMITMIAVLGMAASMSACKVSSYSTSTTTTTTTDANGNSTTTTTTTTTQNAYPEGSCGAAAMDGETHTVYASIENQTGEDITGIYACITGETSWSNMLTEDQYLGDESTAEDFLEFTYSKGGMVYDFGINDASGQTHEFDELDISGYDAEGFTIVVTHSDEGYQIHVPDEYIK